MFGSRTVAVITALGLTAGFAAAIGVVAVLPATASPSHSMDGYLDAFVDDHHVPGLAVSVTSESETVYERVSGRDGNGDPVETDTPFLLGSVAKSFTATLVMQLVESGDVDLDAEIDAYLEGFSPPGGGEAITVRHLLTHTSGFSDAVGMAHSDRFDNSPAALRTVVDELSDVDLSNPPGEQFAYSNANYLALGALVEQKTGQPFGEVLRNRILDPLGMNDSAATAGEAARTELPPGHRYFLDRPRVFDSDFDNSGVPYGYVAASLDDLAAYAAAHLSDGGHGRTRLLDPSSVEEMQGPHVQIGEERWYGLGWRTGTLTAEYDYVEHTGANPGYFAHIVTVPEADVTVVLLANSFSEARAPAMLSAAFDLARISLDREPAPSGNDPLLSALPYVFFALAGASLATLTWIVVRHVRAAAPRRGILRVALPITTALLAAGMWQAPALLGYDLRVVRLWFPDVGFAVVAGAVLWLAAGVAGFASDVSLRRRRARPESLQADPADET